MSIKRSNIKSYMKRITSNHRIIRSATKISRKMYSTEIKLIFRVEVETLLASPGDRNTLRGGKWISHLRTKVSDNSRPGELSRVYEHTSLILERIKTLLKTAPEIYAISNENREVHIFYIRED